MPRLLFLFRRRQQIPNFKSLGQITAEPELAAQVELIDGHEAARHGEQVIEAATKFWISIRRSAFCTGTCHKPIYSPPLLFMGEGFILLILIHHPRFRPKNVEEKNFKTLI